MCSAEPLSSLICLCSYSKLFPLMFDLLPSQALPEAEAQDSFQGWVTVCLLCGLLEGLCKAWKQHAWSRE